MREPDRPTRRTALKLFGATGTMALLAGCPDDNDDDEVDDEDDDANDEPDVDWAEVDEIYLEGHATGWIGIEPEGIEGESNPTLELIEGETYDFRWVNEDGAEHNVEIWDADEDVVDDYETEGMAEQGEEQTLEDVEITTEMEEYACQFHPVAQVGPIDVQEADNDE
ncbi:cupredoxin domain-containing protein [Natrialbaceae archaeon A-gly3]